MADPVILIAGIVILTLILLFTIFALIWYSGFFDSITVGAGEPPCGSLKVVYKFGRGPYKDVGAVFTEVTSLAPKLKCFGIYYDDPKQVAQSKLRWAVGCVLAENTDKPDPTTLTSFKKEDFKEFHFPKVHNVVKTSFPYRSQLSVLMGVYRVYPELARYIRQMKLCAHPFVELYSGSTIEYFAPLSKQEGFYVPESDPHYVDGESDSQDITEAPSVSKTVEKESKQVDLLKDDLSVKDSVLVNKTDEAPEQQVPESQPAKEENVQCVPNASEDKDAQNQDELRKSKDKVAPSLGSRCSEGRPVYTTTEKSSQLKQKHRSEPPQRIPKLITKDSEPKGSVAKINLSDCKVNSTSGSTSSLDNRSGNPDHSVQCHGITSTTRSMSVSDHSMTGPGEAFSDDDVQSYNSGMSFYDSDASQSYFSDDTTQSCYSQNSPAYSMSDAVENETSVEGQTPTNLVELSSDSDGEGPTVPLDQCAKVSPDAQRHS